MPPRRAKPRLKRMDAACDHLGRMGFSKDKIRTTVNYLLKEVYRGDDAWVFLEEDSYRLVIEAILEDQEGEPEDQPSKLDYRSHEEPVGALEACESVNETYGIGETSTSHGYLVGGEDAHEQGRNGEHCTPLVSCHSIRRRPPCYGWISEDEDDIGNALTPITRKMQAMAQCSLSCPHDRKRKSRWDIKPEDI